MSSLPLTKPQGPVISTVISNTVSASASPMLRRPDSASQSADVSGTNDDSSGSHRISAYARLDFDNYTFFVQTLQVVLGRNSNDEYLPSAHHSVDVHLSSKKAISRRHAKIFYNFGTQRFEISVLGRNGAFVDDLFIEKGITVHLVDGTRIQIGDIPFTFVLPSIEPTDPECKRTSSTKFFNPTEALNLRTNLYQNPLSPTNKKKAIALTAESKDKTKLTSGRRSSKADIVRRLSVARRKSLASSSNDEIAALLKELESFHDDEDAVDDLPFDPALINGMEVGDNLTYEQIQKEEDEIDRLVKEHNLTQGVNLDMDSSFSKNSNIDVLDQEVASLAPLIDAQQPPQVAQAHQLLSKDAPLNTPINNYTLKKLTSAEPLRSTLLMGKPVGPRMGKPAPVPPPSGTLYGRPATNHMNAGTGNIYGLQVSNYGSYSSYSGSVYNSMMRPPPPKLEVAVETITAVPVRSLIVPFKAITLDVDTFDRPPICVFKTAEPISNAPKVPRRRKDALNKKPVKLQNFKEVPEQFKTKPSLSVLALVSMVLKNNNSSNGQSFNDILEGIRLLFPYYKYCPDGWQVTVQHGIKFNPMFMAKLKEGPESEWIWSLDEKYIEEREARRKKQQELAVAKAKESAMRAVDYRQRQNYPPYPVGNRPIGLSAGPGVPGSRSMEFASDVKQEGSYMYTTPPSQMLKAGQEVVYHKVEKSEGNIKDQLAANRARNPVPVVHTPTAVVLQSPPVPKTPSTSSPLPTMNQDTKKSLTYLQKELLTLYKARDLSYNTAITTEIITKALATTIAQVNTIGARAGCGDNALGFLVEKAPQQVSKILDIALTKSIKEHQAALQLVLRAQSPVVTSPSKESVGTAAKPANKPHPGLGKPPGIGSGLGRPSFGGPKESSGPKSGPIKPPQFFSNKPLVPEKRLSEGKSSPKKVIKLDD